MMFSYNGKTPRSGSKVMTSVMVLSFTTVNGTDVEPKRTVVALVKPDPEMVSASPPAVEPAVTDNPVHTRNRNESGRPLEIRGPARLILLVSVGVVGGEGWTGARVRVQRLQRVKGAGVVPQGPAGGRVGGVTPAVPAAAAAGGVHGHVGGRVAGGRVEALGGHDLLHGGAGVADQRVGQARRDSERDRTGRGPGHCRRGDQGGGADEQESGGGNRTSDHGLPPVVTGVIDPRGRQGNRLGQFPRP